VGIGTAAPVNKLTVSAATPYISVFNTTAGSTGTPSYSGLRFYGFSEDANGLIASVDAGNAQASNLAGFLRMSTQAPGGGGLVERMRIHTSGGVSINYTADPGAGNLLARGDLFLPALTTETRSLEIGNQRTGNGASLIDLVGDATYTDYGARFIREGGANADTSIYHRGTGPVRVFAQEAAPIVLSNNSTERMRIDSDGNVGVGTTSPNAASIVDAQSTTKGVRFPNMTTTQKNAIANVAGNVVFDTTLGKLCLNTGSGWQTITSV
jgi:hypothetical protein